MLQLGGGKMKWNSDLLKPTQPFFVLDTRHFIQQVYLRQGISHFYAFEKKKGIPLRVVPDGCIDLVFSFDEKGRMHGAASGFTLSLSTNYHTGDTSVFGVRFMPGVRIAGLNARPKDLIGNTIPLEECFDKSFRQELIAGETDFFQRIRIFLQEYTKLTHRVNTFSTADKLYSEARRMIYKSNGTVRIAALAEQTGYSERYIGKVFIEKLGIPPKSFCKIIQFQRTLEYLNYGAPGKMTDAAVDLGYYDQAQCIKEFKKNTGMTPYQYLRLAREKKYISRIQNADYIEVGAASS